jgi:hypothetical protein
MLKLGSIRLELHPSDSATADQKGGEQAIGFKHLAFDTPKLEPAIESLRADGIEPDPITDISKHIPGCRVVFFRDPRGKSYRVHGGLLRRGVSRLATSSSVSIGSMKRLPTPVR